MRFWAILCAFVSANSPVTIMHVGTFTSLADCERFAGAFTVPVKPTAKQVEPSPVVPSFALVCIQANQVGTVPP